LLSSSAIEQPVQVTTLLIVEDDPDLLVRLTHDPAVSDYRVVGARTLAEALEAIGRATFDVALVDLGLGGDAALDAMRAIKARAPETEIVVMSGTSSLAAAIASYELKAFAFVAKPFDADHLLSTVRRAVAHRQVLRANERLAWEQALLNDIGEELRNLLAPEQLVERVLQRLMRGMRVDLSAARLLNPETRAYDISVVSASPELRIAWTSAHPIAARPVERVLATRVPVRVADLHEKLDPSVHQLAPLRSALSVPMFVGDDLIGALSVGSPEPGRFTSDDQRLLGTVANQVAVAVQNARLHAYIRAGKQEWEATFDAIGDPIAVYDRRGRVLRGNAGLATLLQRPLTALRGLSCDEIGLCSAPFPHCSVGQIGRSTGAQEEVARGNQIFSVTTCPVLDVSDGAGTVQIAKNVTPEIQNARQMRQMSDELAATNARLVATVDRLKATQAQLLQAEKLSAIGQLVAGVAHELNNPLTSVIGYAQLLQEELRETGPDGMRSSSEQLTHDLRRIAEESERAARIVRNLLAFARRQSAARAEQDIADVMNRVLALRAYEFRLNAIDLQTAFEPGLPAVLGDGGQLQQALLNLVLNAEQAMRSRPVRRIEVGARRVPAAGAIELVITDTGHGIPDENVRRIFDPFFTTREVGEGTGLGLSICYGIVRDHGGAITVESRVEQGTTFRLLLPARTATQSEALRVLVAHHDSTERDYVAAALTGWGHAVTCAESAEDARTRLAAGGLDAAFVDASLMSDRAAWPAGRAPGGDRTPIIEMSDSADNGGVAPPFELAALRAALRGLTKEYV
jgi:signal transduction histidine kinase/DNA-binding response OmpR family regulator